MVEEKPTGISRRDFLKIMAVGGSLAAADKLGIKGNVAEAQTGEEVDTPTELLSHREMLTDPRLLFENVSQKINSMDDASDSKKEFLKLFSTEYSDEPEKAEERVRVIEHVYKDLGYGERIADVLDRLIDMDRVGDQTDKDLLATSFSLNHFAGVKPLWSSFESIQRLAESSGEVEEVYFEMGLEDLNNIVDWLEPMQQPNDELQRELYVQRSTEMVQESKVLENLADELEPIHRELSQTLTMPLQSINTHLPKAFVGIDVIEVRVGRAQFRSDISDTDIVKLDLSDGSGVFTYSQAGMMEQARFELGQALNTQLHEVSHNTDINRSMKDQLRVFHPEDLINYTEKCLNAFEDFETVIVGSSESDGFSGDEMGLFVFDPLLNIEFGSEMPRDEDDIRALRFEINRIESVSEFAALDENRDLIEEIGLADVYDDSENLLIFDLLTLDGDDADRMREEYGFYGGLKAIEQRDDIFPGIERLGDFKSITPDNIERLGRLMEQIASRNVNGVLSGEEQIIANQALFEINKIKSFATLASYTFLQRSKKLGIDLSTIDSAAVKEVTLNVRYAHTHTMTGPLGQYLGLRGETPNLFPAEELLERYEETSHQKRENMHSFLESKGQNFESELTKVEDVLSTQMQHVNNIADSRARLWGGEGYEDYFDILDEALEDIASIEINLE